MRSDARIRAMHVLSIMGSERDAAAGARERVAAGARVEGSRVTYARVPGGEPKADNSWPKADSSFDSWPKTDTPWLLAS